MTAYFYVWETVGADDGFWKLLCVCLDNEGIGLMERLLQQAEWKFKTEKVTT